MDNREQLPSNHDQQDDNQAENLGHIIGDYHTKFYGLIDKIEIDGESLSGVTEQLDEHRNNFVDAMSEVTIDTVADVETFAPISKRISYHSSGYLDNLRALPRAMTAEDFTEDQVMTAIATQYVDLDNRLVTLFNDNTGQEDIFTAATLEVTMESMRSAYESNKEMLEFSDFCDRAATSCMTFIQNDTMAYLHHVTNLSSEQKNQANKTESENMLARMQSILEQTEKAASRLEESNLKKSKLGKHALDVAKFAAGAFIGGMIAKKLQGDQ